MKHKNKLIRIANVLSSAADELERACFVVDARKEIKKQLKEQNLNLSVETKHNKKSSYLKITYEDIKPTLPKEINGIEIRLKQKKSPNS